MAASFSENPSFQFGDSAPAICTSRTFLVNRKAGAQRIFSNKIRTKSAQNPHFLAPNSAGKTAAPAAADAPRAPRAPLARARARGTPRPSPRRKASGSGASRIGSTGAGCGTTAKAVRGPRVGSFFLFLFVFVLFFVVVLFFVFFNIYLFVWFFCFSSEGKLLYMFIYMCLSFF